MGFAVDWGKVYNPSSIVLHKAKNMPNMGELGSVITGTVSLVEAFKKVDANDPSTKKLADRPAALKVFSKELKTLEKEAKKYSGVIDKGVKLVEKKKSLYPEAYRHLKILKTELAALVARAKHTENAQLKDAKTQKLADKADANAKKLREKGKTDNEINLANYEIKAKRMMATFGTNLKSVLGKAAAAIQKAKSDPTPANYNATIGANGRVLSQTFANIDKMQKDPGASKSKIVKQIPSMAPYRPLLDKYGNQGTTDSKVTLPTTATTNEVNACIKEFSGMVKDLMTLSEKFTKIK